MQTVFDFFVDALIWPIYIYIAGYGLVWTLAFLLSRLFSHKHGIEKGAIGAWVSAIVTHLLLGMCLVIWLCFKAVDKVEAWWQVPVYIIPYMIVLFLDVYLLFLLYMSPSSTSQPVRGRSRNPKKR